MTTFGKQYDFSQDDKIYVDWEKEGLFKENKNAKNGNFFMPLPPPNVTGVLHIGHAQMLTIEDIMVRYNRMIGKKTLWIPGTDHAGISTQVVVEKKLKEEKGLSRYDLGRVKFLDEVWDFVRQSRSTIISQAKKMGASLDWDREQFTLSERNFRAVRKVFKDLYNSGKIYKDAYMINYCPRCKTVLSDLEVNMKEDKGKLVYIKYFLVGKGDNITVATTRPETMFADVAIAVNPNDKRYKKFIGKEVNIPIINRSIPVIADHDVDMNFGTGALKITPTHDKADFMIAKRHNLPIEFYAIDKDGKLTELAGNFAGMKAEEAIEPIIEHLDNIGNLEKVEEFSHNTPKCDRCKTLVQPMVSNQWFVDVSEAAENSNKAIEKNKINIVPERFKKTFYQWLGDIQPWCISRQLWWGHRIPVWTCEHDHINIFDEDIVLEKYNEVKDYKGNLWLDMIVFNLIADSKLENDFNIEKLIETLYKDSFIKSQGKTYQAYIKSYKLKSKELGKYEDDINDLEQILNSVKSQDIEAIMNAGEKLSSYLENSLFIKPNNDTYYFELTCKECGSYKLEQDSDTLDTWFSSGLWPFTVLGRPEKTDDLKEFYPNTVLETGYDIIFFWVARMMFMGYENMKGKGEFDWKPFENVYLHGLVKDSHGNKMSKSKGNGVDPLDKIKEYGTDSLRLSLVLGTTPGSDLNFSDEKLDYNKRFINKLWNASRFVYSKCEVEDTDKLDYDELYKLLKDNKDNLTNFDKWILFQLDELIVQVSDSMDKFYFGESFLNVQKFVWNKFCDWYLEISKYDDGPFTPTVLLYSLATIYKLLHPVIPFVTERLWNKLHLDGQLISANYPNTIGIEKNKSIDQLVDVIVALRALRSKNNIKPHIKTDIFIENFDESILSSYKDIIKQIVGAINVIEIEQDAIVDVVNSFKVGIILPEAEINFQDKLNELEKKLKQEDQFLQGIRKLLASDGFRNNANDNVVKVKEEKKKEVEDKILKIKEGIAKIKLKLK